MEKNKDNEKVTWGPTSKEEAEAAYKLYKRLGDAIDDESTTFIVAHAAMMLLADAIQVSVDDDELLSKLISETSKNIERYAFAFRKMWENVEKGKLTIQNS